MIVFLCTVRGCREELRDTGASLVCSRGHLFDRARSGYVNLLQASDRRSKHPGDAKPAVAARRRLLAAGHEAPIVEAIEAAVADAWPSEGARALDVGCGEGTLLDRLRVARALDAVGLDISVPAVDLAARTFPDVSWVVANADRELPFDAGTFDLVTSITSRRHAVELRRVLAPSGALVVVLPAPDDLVELREVVTGRRVERDRVESAVAELAPHFALTHRTSVRTTASLDAEGLRDLLSSTYRGARSSEQERIGALDRLDVTLARDILRFVAP